MASLDTLNPTRSSSWSGRLARRLLQHWLFLAALAAGLYAGLPWLAPVFMKLGWSGPASAIYTAYSTQCHQLPERSFFLFGPKAMYSLAEIQANWRNTDDPIVLRQFIGDPGMGWKVAWSDRMVAMYTSLFLGLVVYGALRRRMRPMSIWLAVVFAAPMALDGGSHFVSDLMNAGRVGLGFRDTNIWLARLTAQALPAAFYAGDALGSFNSWMRLLTGLVFGLGMAWLVCPLLDESFDDMGRNLENRP